MRVYVAAPWKFRASACDVMDRLVAAGHENGSRWLRGHEDTTDPVRLREEALHDFLDVVNADVMVLLNIEKSEGKAVEQGIALTRGKVIVAVGQPSNVFHHMPQYQWVESVQDVINALTRLAQL